MKLLNEQKIYNDWMPFLKESVGIQDESKLQWMSKLAHFQYLNESLSGSLNESFAYGSSSTLGNVPGQGAVRPGAAPGGPLSFYTGAIGSGDKFPSLLPIAIQIAARTVGFDIVPVIPMPGPTGVLTYLDYVYAGGKTGTENQPLMIKIKANNIDGVEYDVNTLYWGVNGPTSGAAGSENYADGAKSSELIFVGYSRIDGNPIFRVGTTYKYALATTTWVINESIALKEVFDGTAVIVSDNSNAPKAYTAALADDFRVSVSASAELIKALEDHVQGFAGSGTYDQDSWAGPYANGNSPANPMGRGTGENTYYRMMGLQTFTKFIEAETFQVAASVTTEQIQDLNKQYGMDVVSMVENALTNEISQSINKHILSRAFALGWSNNVQTYKTEKFTLNFTFDQAKVAASTSPAYLNMINFTETVPVGAYQHFGGFENMSTIQRRIKSKVLAASNLIAQRGRSGAATFVVTNIQLATALQDTAQYTFAPMANTINQNGGSLYPIGSVAGMTIFVDPNMRWDDNRILIGRKGSDEEPGLKMCPYLLAESIQTIAEGTMSPKIAVKSRYALVEAGHYPQLAYYTIYADIPQGII